MGTTKTYCAPAERADPETLDHQINLFHDKELERLFGNALPIIFLILNEHRQIVYANDRVLETLPLESMESVYGQRPGELLNCIHAKEEEGGCGTSRHCEDCGALQAILGSQEGKRMVKECRLTMEGEISADFRIWTTPIERKGQKFTIFTLEDIQHEKRRQALEKTFFHDLLNTAGGLAGLIEALRYIDNEGEEEEVMDLLETTSNQLLEEIHSGRLLSQAEHDNLHVQLEDHDAGDLIQQVVDVYRSHSVGEGRSILLDSRNPSLQIRTDEILLRRVVGNLVKNALEASRRGETVRIGIENGHEGALIFVNNTSVLGPEIRRQMFQRSFTTKGNGRGIGTYSVKLFTEKYLGGKVWFESSEEAGTTFYLSIPVAHCSD